MSLLTDEPSVLFYPSHFVALFFQSSLADSPKAALMVRNRVQEALRVSSLARWSGTAPVFVYTRPVFVDQNRRFLNLVKKSEIEYFRARRWGIDIN